jgi:hypothetical protein
MKWKKVVLNTLALFVNKLILQNEEVTPFVSKNKYIFSK